MERKPHDYLHLVAPTDGRDDNKPMLCGLNWHSLFYDQATSVEHVNKLREEVSPYPLCPNCDKVFSQHAAGEERPIGNEQLETHDADSIPPDVAAEFATWGAGLRPYQQEAFRKLHTNGQELIVPPLTPGFGKTRTEK